MYKIQHVSCLINTWKQILLIQYQCIRLPYCSINFAHWVPIADIYIDEVITRVDNSFIIHVQETLHKLDLYVPDIG